MIFRKFLRVSLILYTLIIYISATIQNLKENNDDDDKYNQIKRFLLHTKTTGASAGVINNLIHSSIISTEKNTYSSLNNPSTKICMSNPCENGGICTSTGQMTYECKCLGPWRGIHCSIANACYNSPCQNEGTCLNFYDDYWCKCTNDYYGKNCQTKFNNPSNLNNNCRPNICNTGRCISLKTTYYCQCLDGHHGENCEKRLNKRSISKRQSFYQLIQEIKRNKNKQDENDGGRPYYDFRNGIYF